MADQGKDLPVKSSNPTGGQSNKTQERKEKERKEKEQKEKERKEKEQNKSARAAGTEEKDYTSVKVLILNFKFNDLDLKDEIRRVKEAFDHARYESPRHYEIEMDNSLEGLEEEVRNFLPKTKPENTLYIIYYNGHGGITTKKQKDSNGSTVTDKNGKPKLIHTLSLGSHNWPDKVETLWETILGFFESGKLESGKPLDQLHQHLRDEDNKFQKIAEIPWEPISKRIMDAPCDTLVILDCCNAGTAAVTSQRASGLNEEQQSRNSYRKELIGACGWKTETRKHMSLALRDAIKFGLKEEDSSISTSTLVRLMNNYLVTRLREKAPQAVHYILQRNSKDKMILPRLPKSEESREDPQS